MPCFRNVYMKTGVKGLSSTMVIVMQALKALTQKDVQTNTKKSLITKAETFSIHKNKAKITDALSIFMQSFACTIRCNRGYGHVQSEKSCFAKNNNNLSILF